MRKVIILGAAGRDFHNFNVYFRDNKDYRVVAFTAAQIPDIENRTYPPELAGELYPNGIPIYPESELPQLIDKFEIDLVVHAYTDIPHTEVMHKASLANACGADFMLLGAKPTMLKSNKPVVAVCAVRTGCGKSQTTRKVAKILQGWGKKVVAVRHPMPYGDLRKQIVQRFSSYEDFDKYNCTIEEREEYEPLVNNGVVVYAGVDYEKILREVEKEADVIIWDGGNNDTPFFQPSVQLTVFDPFRAGHERLYYAGETNLYLADVAIINKVNTAEPEQIQKVRENIRTFNPTATIVEAKSVILPESPEQIKGKKVLVIEDGPTLTHGEMKLGAGYLAATQNGAAEIVNPREYAVESILETYKKYPHLDKILPAMGYSKQQIKDLETTINRTPCDLVVSATPIDLTKLIKINKPLVHVRYEYEDHSEPYLEDILKKYLNN